MSNRSSKHWFVMIMACLLAVIAVGFPVMTAGVFITPIANDLNILRGSIAMHNTMTLIFKAILSLYSPKAIEKIGLKQTLVSGALMIAGSTFLMGFSESVWLFNLLGAIRGIGSGFIAWVSITMILNEWFEAKNGLITSIVLSFSSIGGAIFSPLFTSLISSLGWQQSYRIMGVLVLIMALPTIFMEYTLDPRDSGLLPYGAQVREDGSERPRQLLKKDQRRDIATELFVLFLAFGLLQTLAVGMPQHFPGFAEDLGYHQEFGASLMSIAMLSSIVFKVGTGYVSDKIGSINATYIIMVSAVIASALFIATTTPVYLYLAAILMGGVFAIPSVALVLLTKRFFGLYNFTQLYPKVSFAVNIGGSISVAAIGFIFDFTGSYIPALIILIITNTFNIFNLTYLKRKYT